MLDVEISLRLALAIGWPYDKVNIVKGVVQVPWKTDSTTTRPFVYTDSSLIWAIAEAYDAFPMKSVSKDRARGSWCALVGSRLSLIRYADTAKKSVALSVIAYSEYQKRLKRKRAGTASFSISPAGQASFSPDYFNID
jgi:hypothetical protein